MEKEKKDLMTKLYEYEETTKRAERGERHEQTPDGTRSYLLFLLVKQERRMWCSDVKAQSLSARSSFGPSSFV